MSAPKAPASSSTGARLLARRSWVDALISGIDRLPGPAWLFYALGTIVFIAGNVGLRWLDGSQPIGGVDAAVLIFSVLTLYGLAAAHFLRRAARRSLAAFRPALGDAENAYPELESRLTNMSPAAALAAVVVALGIEAAGVLFSPTGWGISSTAAPVTNGFTLVQEAIFGVFFSTFIIRAIQQLAVIVLIHRRATNINLYAREPNIAFSRLTLSTSIAVTVPFALANTLAAVEAGISPFEVGLLATVILISIALFVLPLNGMHRRLLQIRESMMAESNRRFESAVLALHRSVDTSDYASADALGKTMAALTVEADRLNRLSTWPWRAETLRRFLSAIALPIVLWTITTLLGRFVL
ncbi:hypothetical protein BH09ACT4_BH09ACT4_09970 [soil metagenome]